MKEIRLYKSKWKILGLLLGSLIFVFGGIHMLGTADTDPVKKIISWTSILFFGLGIPIFLYNLLDRRPQIVINEVGILDRSIVKEFINWNVIDNAYLVDTGVKFICLVMKPGTDLKKSQSWFASKMSSINQSFGFQEININLASIKIDEKRLAEFILEMSKAQPQERQQLLLSWQ